MAFIWGDRFYLGVVGASLGGGWFLHWGSCFLLRGRGQAGFHPGVVGVYLGAVGLYVAAIDF